MVISPRSFFIVASRCTSVHSGFGTTPPKLPEWTSRFACFTTRSKLMTPREPSLTVGRPDGGSGPSAVTAKSAFSRSRCSRTKSATCGLPISSSPSSSRMTLQGRRPRTFSSDSIARICARCWPLLSATPRAKMRPSRMVGSNGGLMPQVERVGRLHVVMTIEQHRRRAFRLEPARHHHRMPRGRHQARVEAKLAEHVEQNVGNFLDADIVCADARVPDIVDQPMQETFALRIDVGEDVGQF